MYKVERVNVDSCNMLTIVSWCCRCIIFRTLQLFNFLPSLLWFLKMMRYCYAIELLLYCSYGCCALGVKRVSSIWCARRTKNTFL